MGACRLLRIVREPFGSSGRCASSFPHRTHYPTKQSLTCQGCVVLSFIAGPEPLGSFLPLEEPWGSAGPDHPRTLAFPIPRAASWPWMHRPVQDRQVHTGRFP